jgi:hypothetical protein
VDISILADTLSARLNYVWKVYYMSYATLMQLGVLHKLVRQARQSERKKRTNLGWKEG